MRNDKTVITPKDDVAGSNAPTSLNDGELILCVNSAEARLFRKQGYVCITSAKMRNTLGPALERGAIEEAHFIVGRIDGVSKADSPDMWPMWKYFKNNPDASAIRKALEDLPTIPTPFKDPEEVIEVDPEEPWLCLGTTIIVARDTFELVRVADTYNSYKAYRPKGRMDEPFIPQNRKICLITVNELRLIRLEGLEKVTIVFTYKIQKSEEMTEMEETRYPTSLRALCGERPDLTVVEAVKLAPPRIGKPFFLGLTRGKGFETNVTTGVEGAGAREYCYETNLMPSKVDLNLVVWDEGVDVRQLVRYGGLTIYTGFNKRRKVQLRSLGLVRADKLLGSVIYNLADNYEVLNAWVIKGTFEKPPASMRDRNSRRVRLENTRKKALPKYTRGYIYNNTPPDVLRKRRVEACKLRKMEVCKGGGVSTVPVKTLSEGETYYLNGRAKLKDGQIVIDQKRCKIRCPMWEPWDVEEMIKWLETSPNVIMAGLDSTDKVFALVKVANGTEDQQRQAVAKWAEEAGRRFPQELGSASWIAESIKLEATATIKSIVSTNWRAESLETACYDRYITTGDYVKPLEIERRNTATLLQRARAYVNKVGRIDEEGSRNTQFSSVLLNMCEKFGVETVRKIAPELSEICTLPEKEKRKVASGILCRFERKNNRKEKLA